MEGLVSSDFHPPQHSYFLPDPIRQASPGQAGTRQRGSV